MGHEIVYCTRCQSRLTSADFDRGSGVRISNYIYCFTCLTEHERTLVDKAKKASSSAAVPRISGSSSRAVPTVPGMPGTARKPAPAPKPVPVVVWAGFGAGVLVVIGLLWALMAKGGSRPPEAEAAPRRPQVIAVPPAAPPKDFKPELDALRTEMTEPLNRGNFRMGQAILDRARPAHPEDAWTQAVDGLGRDVQTRARARFQELKESSARAVERKDVEELRTARAEIAGWGPAFQPLLREFEAAFGAALSSAAVGVREEVRRRLGEGDDGRRPPRGCAGPRRAPRRGARRRGRGAEESECQGREDAGTPPGPPRRAREGGGGAQFLGGGRPRRDPGGRQPRRGQVDGPEGDGAAPRAARRAADGRDRRHRPRLARDALRKEAREAVAGGRRGAGSPVRAGWGGLRRDAGAAEEFGRVGEGQARRGESREEDGVGGEEAVLRGRQGVPGAGDARRRAREIWPAPVRLRRHRVHPREPRGHLDEDAGDAGIRLQRGPDVGQGDLQPSEGPGRPRWARPSSAS